MAGNLDHGVRCFGSGLAPFNEVVNFATCGRKCRKGQPDRFWRHFSDCRMYGFIALYSYRFKKRQNVALRTLADGIRKPARFSMSFKKFIYLLKHIWNVAIANCFLNGLSIAGCFSDGQKGFNEHVNRLFTSSSDHDS